MSPHPGRRRPPPGIPARSAASALETLQQQVVESRVILGSRLALYQIHSATLDSGVLDDHRVLNELLRLREQGLRVGLTVTGPRQAETIRRAIGIRVDGIPLFQTVQATWNLLEPSAGGALADARSAGCGVIVKEVLANGRLTERHGGPRVDALRRRAAASGLRMETLAVAAALAQPWADVVLSGAVTREQLYAQAAALDLDGAVPPPPRLAEPAEDYWRMRAAIAWK